MVCRPTHPVGFGVEAVLLGLLVGSLSMLRLIPSRPLTDPLPPSYPLVLSSESGYSDEVHWMFSIFLRLTYFFLPGRRGTWSDGSLRTLRKPASVPYMCEQGGRPRHICSKSRAVLPSRSICPGPSFVV